MTIFNGIYVKLSTNALSFGIGCELLGLVNLTMVNNLVHVDSKSIVM